MVVPGPNGWLRDFFGRYTAPLLLAGATIAIGILFGVLAVDTLTVADKVSLVTYVHNFLTLEFHRPTWHGVFRPALASNLKMLGLLYVLGVSVAGLPLVLVLLFFRGFVLGFSVGFLVETLRVQGMLVTVAAIGLQDLFLLPALALAGAGALSFSWQLISPRHRNQPHAVLQGFAAFTGLVLSLSLVVVVGTAIETYAGPLLLHLMGGILTGG